MGKLLLFALNFRESEIATVGDFRFSAENEKNFRQNPTVWFWDMNGDFFASLKVDLSIDYQVSFL